jgi:hypothetical protein
MPGVGDPPDVRASDAERERVVEQLRDHALAGRLTVEELDERSARAYAEVTRSQLAGLLVDLPTPVPERRPAPPPYVGPPGVRPFTYEWHLPLLHKVEERVVIELEPDHRRGGTRMIARGTAPRRVRRAFAQLEP